MLIVPPILVGIYFSIFCGGAGHLYKLKGSPPMASHGVANVSCTSQSVILS